MAAPQDRLVGALPACARNCAARRAADGGGLGVRKDKTGGRIDHAFLWQNGKIRNLKPIVPYSPFPLLINNRGQVVGQADTPAKDKYGQPIQHAVLWQNGKPRDLRTLGGAESQA